jgi:hypothetical protein
MAHYNSLDSGSPPGSRDPYYNSSTGDIAPANLKTTSKWIKFGVPVGVLLIAGAVVGAILGTRHHGHSSASNSNTGSPAAASSAISAKNAVGIFPTATDSEFMVPIYPSTVRFLHILRANFLPVHLTDKYCCFLGPHV